LVVPDVDAPGQVRFPGQRSPHGVGQERGEVVDAVPAFAVRIRQEKAVWMTTDEIRLKMYG
jgi:hypothetical protein